MDERIGKEFHEPLGRVVIRFAELDEALAITIFTLLGNDPLYMSKEGDFEIKGIRGPIDQQKFRYMISSVPTMQRIQMLKRLALSSFPSDKEYIRSLIKGLEAAVEHRNALMHYMWDESWSNDAPYTFQIGFSLTGNVKTIKRTPQEVNEFAEELIRLSRRTRGLHLTLLGVMGRSTDH